MGQLPSRTEMGRALYSCDAAYDGIFYVGVRTTGVFCRPGCKARKPLLSNCVYFASAGEAMQAGFRPCRRCRPLQATGQQPQWVRRLLDEVERDPNHTLTDQHLSAMDLHPGSIRRFFLRNFGMTFQAYCRGARMAKAKNALQQGAAMESVAFNSGYASQNGFRDAFQRTFGKPPGQSRQTDAVLVDWRESPVGPLILGATATALCLLEFSNQERVQDQLLEIKRYFDLPVLPGRNALIDQVNRELDDYFSGELRRFRTPLVYPGTPFQRRVWQALLQIPYGRTWSYEKLALEIGAPAAQRAVGAANGRNRIVILIPCHRVVNKNGRLGGYGGGLWRKQFLLDLEQGHVDRGPNP